MADIELVIKIPEEFESHFYNDRFKDSLERIKYDISPTDERVMLSGRYEVETIDMLIDALGRSITLTESLGRLILDKINRNNNEVEYELFNEFICCKNCKYCKDSTCQTYDCALGIINSPSPLVDYCSKAEKVNKCLNCGAILKDSTTNYCPDCINRPVEIMTNLLKGMGVIKEE